MSKKFAVLDTETNWKDQVMSIGVVTALDGDFEALSDYYIIIDEAAKVGGMYSSTLYIDGQSPVVTSHEEAIKILRKYLSDNNIEEIFAYNANFDKRHLPELRDYTWKDILKLAAYKQHNPMIPATANCCGTGRLKSGYRVENILSMFGEYGYNELHNALTDSVDELRIMKHLQHEIEKYPVI